MNFKTIFVAGLMASMAFVACNKETSVENGDQSLKSVTINLANLVTKSSDVIPIMESEQVAINEFQIFFADGAGKFYDAYGVDDAATPVSTYVNLKDGGNTKNTFHYLDHSVSTVYVVANCGDLSEKGFAGLAELKAELDNVKVEDQQADMFENLKLYGQSGLTPASEAGVHGTNYYDANVTVAPMVSRLQITGVEYKATEDGGTRAHESLAFGHFAINNFYKEAALTSVAGSGNSFTVSASELDSKTIDETTVWKYFDDLKGQNVWYSDEVDFTLSETTAWKNEEPKLAYHFFPGAEIPQIVVRFVADGEAPLFLATSSLPGVDNNVGKIYNVSFAFDDEDIENPLKCVNVTVEVLSWQIIAVTPEF